MPPQVGPFDPPLDVPHLTEHDRVYAALYIRLLDADAAGVDWRTAGREILGLEPDVDTYAAKRTFDAFLDRAKWMTRTGYKLLLKPDE
ncbi:MAG: DUF2285 domain-containing protein [Hyphomicrobium sp.]